MSRKRVVVGMDERGRPITGWAEPEAADEPRYGHMQPAFAAPIERRVATPSQRAWNGGLIQAAIASPTTTREEPTMPETPPQAAQEPTAGPTGADVQLDRLSTAAEAARRAQTAWQVASEDLARAYADVAWLLDETRRDVTALPPPVAGRIRLATGEIAKGNTAAQSRANGNAAMLAKRAPKAEPKSKAEKVYKRTPEQRETMRIAQLASIQRRAEAAAEASA